MKIRVKVRGHEQPGRVAARFRAAADGGLRSDVQTELQGAAPPVLARTRAAVLSASFPATSPAKYRRPQRSTGLRARLAAATHTEPLSAPAGVRFTVDGSAVEPGDGRGGHKLAKYTDTELAPRWRHQVFGNAEAWFNQRGEPWFFTNIRAGAPSFRAGVLRAMQRTASKIMGGR